MAAIQNPSSSNIVTPQVGDRALRRSIGRAMRHEEREGVQTPTGAPTDALFIGSRKLRESVARAERREEAAKMATRH